MDRVAIIGLDEDMLRDAAAVRHVVKVLRLGPGDEFLGYEAARETRLRIEAVEPGALRVRELASRALAPAADVTVAQCLLKGERWDTFLEKAAELGAARVLPVLSERTVARPRAERLESRMERWRGILRGAAAQCAGATPRLLELAPLTVALQQLAECPLRLLLCLAPDAAPLARCIPANAARPVALLLGPEGDFSPGELNAARQAGWTTAHLGGRILRSETAAAAALTLTLQALGALQQPVPPPA